MKFLGYLFVLILLAPLTGCQCSHSAEQPKQSAGTTELSARGKAVYVSNCTSCHHVNPKLAGSLGPAVAGSSKELLEARILHGSYPEGYTPKRSSRVMQALTHLGGDIDALYQFLNE